MYPLRDWKNLPRGYKFGQKTYYNNFHIGLDLIEIAGVPVFAPEKGNVSNSVGPQGGNTASLTTQKGNLLRFLHLVRFGAIGPVKEGEVIGYVGKTGSISGSTPHLHVDCQVQGKYVDPEIYFKSIMHKIPVTYINGSNFSELNQKVEMYSNGLITLEHKNIVRPLGSTFIQEQAYALVEELNLKDRFIVIFYPGDASQTFAKTFYYPKRNLCISTIPQFNPRVVAFELSHQFQIWCNENGAWPPIPVEDNFIPPEIFIFGKYETLIPHIELLEKGVQAGSNKPMTEQEVKLRYLVAFNKLPSEAELRAWVGKPSLNFDKQILKDRAKFLTEQAQQNP